MKEGWMENDEGWMKNDEGWRQTDRLTDIGECRVVFATEKFCYKIKERFLFKMRSVYLFTHDYLISELNNENLMHLVASSHLSLNYVAEGRRKTLMLSADICWICLPPWYYSKLSLFRGKKESNLYKNDLIPRNIGCGPRITIWCIKLNCFYINHINFLSASEQVFADLYINVELTLIGSHVRD